MRRVFTLIEILVVIGIIAVIASILFPVYMTSRRRASATACLSNIRQIGMAIRMYVDDNDGVYPELQVWSGRKLPGASGSLACPEVQGNWRSDLKEPARYGIAGYGMNTSLTYIAETLPSLNQSAPAESAIKQPALVILLAESPFKIQTLSGADPFAFNEAGRANALEESWRRHSEGAHYLFCDGHVKWLRDTQIWDGTPIGSEPPSGMPRFSLR
jgi:prepilin-type processing-associated H-X9-DG protein/prepilin-type N-terminal cleavage/methylation domain-containing protein